VLARAIDDAAGTVGVDFIGGYSALVQKGATPSERRFLDSIPEALSSTKRLCSSVNAATTRAGINMDVVATSANHQGRRRADARRRRTRVREVCLFRKRGRRQSVHGGRFHGVSEAER
jgi:uncharacterized protein (UPF0210 family)